MSLVVKFREGGTAPEPFLDAHVTAHVRADAASLAAVAIAVPGATLRPLFVSVTPRELDALREAARRRVVAESARDELVDLSTYARVVLRANTDVAAALAAVRALPAVERAYVQPPPMPPPAVAPDDDPDAVKQTHLNAAPEGINARYAWGWSGGAGEDVRVVDVEYGWIFTHPDLPAVSQWRGNVDANVNFNDHGTSVLGVLGARDNTLNGVGIAPSASFAVVSTHTTPAPTDADVNIADAVVFALRRMSAGDVLLLEAQTRVGASAYIGVPAEVEPAVFDAVRLATASDVTVVACAGNSYFEVGDELVLDAAGGFDLDGTGFASAVSAAGMSNPSARDSGAVIVAAAFNNSTSGAAATWRRVPSSAYGARIDCFAQGSGVLTLSSQESSGIDDDFSGTSAAGAIVAGAAAVLQGVARAALGRRLGSAALRSMLANAATGTAKDAAEVTAIGVMPDLGAILDSMGDVADVYVRDHVDDVGEPHTLPLSRSPDLIVVHTAPTPSASEAFGEATASRDDLSEEVTPGMDHRVYVRVRNRSTAAVAQAVTATVYWSPPATLVRPDLWNLIGASDAVDVPVGGALTVLPAIGWPAAALPALGHYCMVGVLSSENEPEAPLGGAFGATSTPTWDDFLRMVRFNNNITWRNFNVVSATPTASAVLDAWGFDLAPGPIVMPFLFAGATDRDAHMELIVRARPPAGVTLEFAGPSSLVRFAGALSKRDADAATRTVAMRFRARKGRGDARPLPQASWVTPLKGGSLHSVAIVARVQGPLVRTFHVHIIQRYEGIEVGRLVWRVKVE